MYQTRATIASTKGRNYQLHIQGCGKAIGIYPAGVNWLDHKHITEIPVSNESQGITRNDKIIAKTAIDAIEAAEAKAKREAKAAAKPKAKPKAKVTKLKPKAKSKAKPKAKNKLKKAA